MTVKNVIVMTIPFQKPETWGSLTNLCKSHGFPYNLLARKKFPFNYAGCTLSKSKFNEKTILLTTNKEPTKNVDGKN